MKTSTETLTHYQCESCGQWWTIGDAPEMSHMYCPRCGNKHLTKVGKKMVQSPAPLWTDERIAVCADIHSMGHYETDNKTALEFRITTALKEMHDEYETILAVKNEHIAALEEHIADINAVEQFTPSSVPPKITQRVVITKAGK